MPQAFGFFRGPAAYRPMTPWTPLGGLFASATIVVVGIFAAALLLGPARLAELGPNQESTALATLGVWQLITIALTLAASRLFRGSVRDVLALRAPAGPPSVYAKALVCMFVLELLVSIVQSGVGSGDRFADLRPVQKLVGGGTWALALFVIGIGAPLSEELLFRGFLLSALASSRLGFAGAALLTSAAWTLLHAGYTLSGLGEVFVIGLYFSWLLWRTGSLRVAIFCHALYNTLIALVLLYVPL
jgi:membrane protease YdiL (CAAX protease family)